MTGDRQDTAWPLPKFCFVVDIAGIADGIRFQEVSGLEIETQAIEYRRGNSSFGAPIKMPGLRKVGNVTLKKGTFVNDDRFWAWYKQVALNASKRADVTITLLDEGGNPTMVWTLTNAWPAKISGTDLKSDGNEVAIETLEIAHEGLRIQNS